jgi:imidazolonepropionase-like amidohydrolase
VIGDWPGPDGRMRANYGAGALAAAVQRAHAAGARVAVHATSPAGIEAAIEAGVDSIEHGVGLDDTHIEAMAARGIALVPTLLILPGIPEVIAGWPVVPSERTMLLAAVPRHGDMTRRAVEAGVLVLAGTDAGMGPHGMVRHEIGCLLAAGVPAGTALAAGSWAARRFLGLPGIEEGAPADLVAYADDPRADPETLAHPCLRILDGRLLPPTEA